ncbi:armadillo-type protein [Roridomyces roridus]|uniref:Armadillo-type protein n=1 Tax=Roridomyces roridus TaxID=1738132 RepID=A0AAD7C8M6_9AGAR|nr:armadillo-type protein [Roridomyces roridus]
MQSLGNQSRASLVSWWSDSNPALKYGPTINLHTLAKPLLRFMYHRQARKYIGNLVDITSELAICSSYLGCKYVADRTKVMVLRRLGGISGSWEPIEGGGPSTIHWASTFSETWQLLESSNADIRMETARVITNLLRFDESLVVPVMELNLVEKLVSMLHDDNLYLVWKALDALTAIALWPLGAKAVAVSDALGYTEELLASPYVGLCMPAAVLLGTVSCHSGLPAATVAVIAKSNPLTRIAAILVQGKCDELGKDSWTVSYGLRGLQRMAHSADGAQRIMDTTILAPVVVQFLEPKPNYSLHQEMSCRLIGKLASHENVIPKLLELDTLPKMVQLLVTNPPIWVAYAAVAAMCQFSCWKVGAEAILETEGALATISKLHYQNKHWNRERDELLQNLGNCRPESTAPTA